MHRRRTYCLATRTDLKDTVLCTWTTGEDNDTAMVRLFGCEVGARISQPTHNTPSFVVLLIFCLASSPTTTNMVTITMRRAKTTKPKWNGPKHLKNFEGEINTWSLDPFSAPVDEVSATSHLNSRPGQEPPRRLLHGGKEGHIRRGCHGPVLLRLWSRVRRP